MLVISTFHSAQEQGDKKSKLLANETNKELVYEKQKEMSNKKERKRLEELR